LSSEVVRTPRPRPYVPDVRRRGKRRKTIWIGLAATTVCILAAIAIVLIGQREPSSATADLPSSATNAVGQTNRGTELIRRDESAANTAGQASSGTPEIVVAKQPAAGPTPGDVSRPGPLLLESNSAAGAAPVARLPLAAGQHVHGPPGGRATVNVAREGLTVDVPGVVFESVDFVWRHAADVGDTESTPAVLVLRASSVELRGCTFRSNDSSVDALRWIHPSEADTTRLSLPSGRVTVDCCVFRNVAAAIDGRTRGAVALRFSNVLHLGAGPLVRLVRVPGADEPAMLSLARTTLRESGPLLECGQPTVGPVGKISIETGGCVFSPREGEPLVTLADESSADAVLRRVAWTGQGSLVRPGCPIAGHRDDTGQIQTLPEDLLSIDGLVRGEVEFAGKAQGTASDSRAVRWLAPLRSDEAPGIDPTMLAE